MRRSRRSKRLRHLRWFCQESGASYHACRGPKSWTRTEAPGRYGACCSRLRASVTCGRCLALPNKRPHKRWVAMGLLKEGASRWQPQSWDLRENS